VTSSSSELTFDLLETLSVYSRNRSVLLFQSAQAVKKWYGDLQVIVVCTSWYIIQ